MRLPFELQIALRYLLARRKQAFISVISLISTVGVIVGVMALVLALALMTGLQQELRDRILGSNAHVYVWKPGGIDDYRGEITKLTTLPGWLGSTPLQTISYAPVDALRTSIFLTNPLSLFSRIVTPLA